MARPKTRSNGVCSPISTAERVQSCCCDLKDAYDVADALHSASELFFRLTGRQSKYAGNCLFTVYPCKRDCSCGFSCASACGSCSVCGNCSCKLSVINLPGACEIVQVVVDGLIVDPAKYVLSESGELAAIDNLVWPRCAKAKVSRPLSHFVNVADVGTDIAGIVVTPSATFGVFNVAFDGGLPNAVGYDENTVLHFVGEDGWEWLIPWEGLTFVSTVVDVDNYTYTTQTFTGLTPDVMVALDRNVYKTWLIRGPFFDSVAYNTPVSLENPTLTVRSYSGDTGDREGTFEVTYRTGCNTPLEVQNAVAELACELAKARCGDDSCRLPSNLRSFKLDGDRIDQVDPYFAMSNKLTGIPSVDMIIKSINPNGLFRRGRLIGHGSSRKLRRFKW